MSSRPPLPDADAGTVHLDVDLAALASNWRRMRDLSSQARCGAAVKADAYGVGADQAAPRLAREGCRDFFVADANEGARLRPLLTGARIFVLNGVFETSFAQTLAHDLIPVINSPEQAAFWSENSDGRAYALHIDTGMNRLGLTPEQAAAHAKGNTPAPALLMSHFACADEPDHPLNARQIEEFEALKPLFPGVEASLANSPGIHLGERTHHDLTRPGIALYGGNPVADLPIVMDCVVTAKARVLQIRQAKSGQSISYSASQVLSRDTTIAVCGIGYADGYHRSASGAGVPLRLAIEQGGSAAFDGVKVPVIGKVTMDLTMFDVTDLGPDVIKTGDWLELIGPAISLEAAAQAAGTVNYELLTSLGSRYARHYTG